MDRIEVPAGTFVKQADGRFAFEPKGFCPTGPGGGIDNSCGRGQGRDFVSAWMESDDFADMPVLDNKVALRLVEKSVDAMEQGGVVFSDPQVGELIGEYDALRPWTVKDGKKSVEIGVGVPPAENDISFVQKSTDYDGDDDGGETWRTPTKSSVKRMTKMIKSGLEYKGAKVESVELLDTDYSPINLDQEVTFKIVLRK